MLLAEERELLMESSNNESRKKKASLESNFVFKQEGSGGWFISSFSGFSIVSLSSAGEEEEGEEEGRWK